MESKILKMEAIIRKMIKKRIKEKVLKKILKKAKAKEKVIKIKNLIKVIVLVFNFYYVL